MRKVYLLMAVAAIMVVGCKNIGSKKAAQEAAAAEAAAANSGSSFFSSLIAWFNISVCV